MEKGVEDSEWDWACNAIESGLKPAEAMRQVEVSGLTEREKRIKQNRFFGKLLRASKSKCLYAQEIEKVRSLQVCQLPLEDGVPESARRVAALMKMISEQRNGKALPFPVRVVARLFPDCPTSPTEAGDMIQCLREYGCIKPTRKGSAHGKGKGKATRYKWHEPKNDKSANDGDFDL